MYLALKEMKKEKGRFALILTIVLLIAYLVFFLTGLAYGLAQANRSAVDQWGAEAVVLQEGTNANLSASQLDQQALKDFKDWDTSALSFSRVQAHKAGETNQDQSIDLVKLGVEEGSAAYPDLVEGQQPENDQQVIASLSLKEEEGLVMGDQLDLNHSDERYEIVGFSPEAKYNVSPVLYTRISQEDLDQLESPPAEQNEPAQPGQSPASGQINALLLHDSAAVESIEGEGYDLLAIDDFILQLPGYVAQLLTFGLMIGFLILISTIVLAVFIYIISMQKKESFGIMKVQGISNTAIGSFVLYQSFLVSAVGLGLAFVLTLLSDYLLPAQVPFQSNYPFYGGIALLMLLTSLLASLFSVRAVTQVDPLEVMD